MMWTTWRKPLASACFLLLPVPTFAQVTRPSSRGSQSLSRMSRLIRLTSTHKKHGAPDCCFVGSSLASDSGRLESGNASQAHRPPCARTPASPTLGSVIGQFNFHMTASLLGKTATDFCRQLERPGDVICEGNRSISAAQAPSTSAHPFARSLSFTCHANLRCGHFLLQVVCLDQQQ